MSVENRDLPAACIWATATAVAVAVVGDGTPLRVLLGLPMAVLVPGHVLLRAIGIRTHSLLEHLVYAVGTSLVVGISGGFILNAVGALTPAGWATWFFLFVVTASLVAARRGGASYLPSWPRPAGFHLRHAVACALAASVATGAYVLAVRDEAKQQQYEYTEFSMLPSIDGGRLIVAVRSAEARTQRFDLEVTIDGHQLAAFRSLAMAPGDVWTREVPVPLLADPQKAEARLYRLEDERLYRQVTALVPGS
jgi:hypothetical protein